MKKLFLLELVFLVVVVVVISSFIYTRVMAQENKLTAQEITISDIVIKEDYEALEVNITIPVIQGLEDKQVEEKKIKPSKRTSLIINIGYKRNQKSIYNRLKRKEGI